MKKFIIGLIVIALSMPSIGQECNKVSKEIAFSESDAVFLGEILIAEKESFLVAVHEVFKGKVSDTVNIARNQNSFSGEAGEVWLLYAYQKGNELLVDYCSASKTFSNPFGVQDYNLPEPPPPYFRDQSLSFLAGLVVKTKSLNELYYDLLSLRQQKLQDQVVRLESDNAILRGQLEEASGYNNLILGLVGSLVALQVFFGLRQLRK